MDEDESEIRLVLRDNNKSVLNTSFTGEKDKTVMRWEIVEDELHLYHYFGWKDEPERGDKIIFKIKKEGLNHHLIYDSTIQLGLKEDVYELSMFWTLPKTWRKEG